VSRHLQLCHALCQSSCGLSAHEQLYLVSSAAIFLLQQILSCNSSAVTDWLQGSSSAMKCKLLCNLSFQLQSVCSVMICQLGSSLLAQSQLQNSSSAAMCQLSSAQLSSAAMRSSSVNLSIQLSGQPESAATCQLNCTRLAEMKLVISAATCWLSCSLSAHQDAVHSAAVCQLNCVRSAWLWYVSSTVIF